MNTNMSWHNLIVVLTTALSFGMWQHNVYAGVFVFALPSVVIIVKEWK